MERLVVTQEEACKMIKLNPLEFQKKVQSGEIPAYKDGRGWKIPIKLLEEYVISKAKAESEKRKNV